MERMLAVAMRCPNVYLVPDCYVYIDACPLRIRILRRRTPSSGTRTIFGSTYPEQPEADHRRLEEAPWTRKPLSFPSTATACLLGIEWE